MGVKAEVAVCTLLGLFVCGCAGKQQVAHQPDERPIAAGDVALFDATLAALQGESLTVASQDREAAVITTAWAVRSVKGDQLRHRFTVLPRAGKVTIRVDCQRERAAAPSTEDTAAWTDCGDPDHRPAYMQQQVNRLFDRITRQFEPGPRNKLPWQDRSRPGAQGTESYPRTPGR